MLSLSLFLKQTRQNTFKTTLSESPMIVNKRKGTIADPSVQPAKLLAAGSAGQVEIS